MTGRGYLLALEPGEALLAQACASGADLETLLAHLHRTAPTAELDKAWPLLHRCLSALPAPPLAAAILGGRAILDASDRVAKLVPAGEVGAVAAALEALDEATFRDGFEASAPPEPDGESEELDLLYSWSWFQHLRTHYREAAAAGRAVLFAGERRPGAWDPLAGAAANAPGAVDARARTSASA